MSDRDESVSTTSRVPAVARWLAAALGIAVSSWVAWAAVAWIRYGRPRRGRNGDAHEFLLDQFMPDYEVAERHTTRVAAPADITFEAAINLDLQQSRIINGLFKTREFILRAQPPEPAASMALLPWAEALGWRVLAQIPGREIVLGAVTRPWEPNVVFRPLRPDQFADFSEPDYVKIIWTLRSDPLNASESIARTDTRVTTTDSGARAKFRVYWAFLSPGIRLIRIVALGWSGKRQNAWLSAPVPHPP